MDEETKIDKLRHRLGELRKRRDYAIMQKGLAAEANKDIPENFEYDLWEQNERNLTSQIHDTIREVDEEYKKQAPPKSR